MLMADVFSITLIIVGFLLAQQGLWLMSRALWPGRCAAATVRCRRNPVACVLLGIPVTVVAVVSIAVAGNALGAIGQVSAFALAILYWIYANVGTAGFVTHVGQRLSSPADETRPWAATVRGGVAIELAWLVPFAGWFGVFPLSIVLGAGATTLSWFRMKAAASTLAPPMSPATSTSEISRMIEPTPGYVVREPAEALR